MICYWISKQSQITQLHMTTTAVFGFWNMLSDALSPGGEFASRCPDDMKWEIRGPRVVAVIDAMFAAGYAAVGVVEDDQPLYILHELNKNRTIHCIAQRVRNAKNVNAGYVQMSKRTTGPTFADAIPNPELCNSLIGVMNTDDGTTFTEKSLYVSDYMNTIYWNPEKLQIGLPVFDEMAKNDASPYKFYMGKGDHGFTQQFFKGDVECNITVAHLKSGEGASEERERVASLTQLLAVPVKNRIVLMDSNSSWHYQEDVRSEVESTVADVIARFEMKNLIVQDCDWQNATDVCFKLRPGTGNQPRKMGQLMKDTIDAALVGKNVVANAVPVSGVVKSDPKHKELTHRLRTDPVMRIRVSNWVLNWDNQGTDTELRYAGGVCEEIKDKGKTIRKMSANVESLWGEDTTKNNYDGMAAYLGLSDVTDEVLASVFNGLYPNEQMPSDHPPIAIKVQL